MKNLDVVAHSSDAHATLAAFYQCMGGQLLCVSAKTFSKHGDGFFVAPFCRNLGVHWETKTCLYTRKSAFSVGGIIHEAGHIFACTTPPYLNSVGEMRFLGWEFAVAKFLGLRAEHAASSTDYAIDWKSGDKFYELVSDLGNVDSKEFRAFEALSVRRAKRRGLVNAAGLAVSVR